MLDVIIAALATWQAIEIWRHSLLFAPLRAITEMWTNKIGELLSCPFCLSPWIGLACVVILHFSSISWLCLCFGFCVKALAVARLSNLGNDFFKQWTLTPKVGFGYDDEWDGGNSIG